MARKERKRKSWNWLTVLSGGLGIALFTFLADKAWVVYRHRDVGPRYVDEAVRVDGDQGQRILVFVRNNSDEPLDLVHAQIDITGADASKDSSRSFYPVESQAYKVAAAPGRATLTKEGDKLVLKSDITQAIEARAVDQFAFVLAGPEGKVDLSRATLRVALKDVKGQTYTATGGTLDGKRPR